MTIDFTIAGIQSCILSTVSGMICYSFILTVRLQPRLHHAAHKSYKYVYMYIYTDLIYPYPTICCTVYGA